MFGRSSEKVSYKQTPLLELPKLVSSTITGHCCGHVGQLRYLIIEASCTGYTLPLDQCQLELAPDLPLLRDAQMWHHIAR